MVWFASVENGLVYEISWDASQAPESQQAFIEARQRFDEYNKK